MVTLGQWVPIAALPGALCRWRGPRHRDAPATTRRPDATDGTAPPTGTPPPPTGTRTAPPTGTRAAASATAAATGTVAVTFDDGPDAEGTPAVVERLESLGMRATFFPLATHARRHPDLVRLLVERGHAVGTHGSVHSSHLLRSPRWVVDDLRRALDDMAALGVHPRWYRPPYGQATATTLLAARALRLEPVLWSAWGREWATADPGAVARRLTDRLRPGTIVLLHDSDSCGPAGMWRRALAALGPLAEALAARGLRAVTLDELVPRDLAEPTGGWRGTARGTDL